MFDFIPDVIQKMSLLVEVSCIFSLTFGDQIWGFAGIGILFLMDEDWRPIRNRLNFPCEGHSIPISNIPKQPEMFDPKNHKIHQYPPFPSTFHPKKRVVSPLPKKRGLIEAEVGHDDDPPVSLREILRILDFTPQLN